MKTSLVAEILLARHAKRGDNEKPYTDYADILKSRDDVLGRFQTVFAPDAIDNLAEDVFRDFLSFKHNRHWTGLQRPTAHVCDDMPRLRAALTHLFNEELPVADRIDDLTQNQDISVPGIGVGILTPLLLVQYPRQVRRLEQQSRECSAHAADLAAIPARSDKGAEVQNAERPLPSAVRRDGTRPLVA